MIRQIRPLIRPRSGSNRLRRSRRTSGLPVPTYVGAACHVRYWLLTIMAMLIVLAPLACSPPSGGSDNGGNDNGSRGGSTGGGSRVPDGFPHAASVSFDEVNRLIIDGEIESADEVAVYELGPLSLGDQIGVLCIAKSGSRLDPMAAVFDANGYRVFWNDDINAATSNFDSALGGFVRHDSSNYFLAITSTSFFATTGEFRCTLQLDAGVAVAPIIGQTVVLHLAESKDVSVAEVDYGDLPAFDAAEVSLDFAGDTEELIQLLLETVREDYEAYDVTILTTDDDEPKENFTTIFFGTSSPQAIFGIADEIDLYNGNDMDSAIIFAEAFGGLSTSLKKTAQAVGNVVAHEIGHTLGLMHTADVTTLMDTTGADSTLMVDQSFGTADIVDFPIGKQNAPLLLEETVGRAIAKSHGYINDGRWRCGTCGATLSLINGTKTATP